ncbi:hypothetical protein [Pantoea sp. At-9b]|uniref:hypothetical protein n=1 Tax=Pantoea sp. (strain At-9b) TaxID=592316 RepID=UPI0001B3E840|nr:hypothetical protein [Pantoea sp. At-9b]
MNIKLLTGQRRLDTTGMKFSDIADGRLFITQSKISHKIVLPVSLRLEAIGLDLNEVIEQCRISNPSDNLIYSFVKFGGCSAGPVMPDAMTGEFAEARDLSGI